MKGRWIYRAETTSHFDSPQEQPSWPSAEAHVENATQVTCGTRFVNSRGGEGREVRQKSLGRGVPPKCHTFFEGPVKYFAIAVNDFGIR